MGTIALCLLTLAAFLSLCDCDSLSELFQPYWASDHVLVSSDEQPLKLALDSTSGCGIGSKKKYMFGQVSMQIKLVEGDSAGTVTAFYMSSEGSKHNELDFEFLGNVSGEPYLVQTNVYVNGEGNREQRHTLWFDPTTDFHTYSFLWNRHQVRFMVDDIPLRVFENKETNGVLYLNDQPMGVYASVWNADDWATQGGSVKTNWSHAPFVSEFRSFKIDAWWDSPGMSGLSPHQRRQLKWVRSRHLVYDYCKDIVRFGQMVPPEC